MQDACRGRSNTGAEDAEETHHSFCGLAHLRARPSGAPVTPQNAHRIERTRVALVCHRGNMRDSRRTPVQRRAHPPAASAAVSTLTAGSWLAWRRPRSAVPVACCRSRTLNSSSARRAAAAGTCRARHRCTGRPCAAWRGAAAASCAAGAPCQRSGGAACRSRSP
jgi:hypothetical protein